MYQKAISTAVFFLLSFACFGQSQERDLLQIEQNYFEASVGDKITFTITNLSDSAKVIMKDAPESAVLDESLRFEWQIPTDYEGERVMVNFSLEDENSIIDHKSIMIQIKKSVGLPIISISSDFGEKAIYNLQVGTPLEINALIVPSDPIKENDFQIDYYFNDKPSLKQIEGAEISIENNELNFKWTPNHTQLIEKYFRFSITAMDDDFHISKKTLLLVVSRKNQSPYFIYPVLDEYYVSHSEALNVDLAAGDPDGDSLIYRLIIPTKIGNPKLSEKGKFSWRLNEDQIMRLRNKFPIEVTVEASEIGNENPHTIVKRFKILKSVRNQPPKILNLQNERIQEGLTYRKTVFIQDGNDEYSELEIEIRGAPEGMQWNFTDNMLSIEWTPGFDVVGVEMKPEKFDMLLVVRDPYGYVDQKAFTLTVEHRENTELTFEKYMEFRDDVVYMIETLSQIHREMMIRENRIQSTKKSLSVLTMFFAAYTASGTYYDEGSFAYKMVPFVGSLAVIAGGINAFGFNDLPMYGNIRENSFVLQQKLMYILAILNEYRIEGPNSPNLENAEFRENLKTFEQWAVKDKLDFKHYYSNFLTLSYVKRQKRKEIKQANSLGREASGLLFLDMNSF